MESYLDNKCERFKSNLHILKLFLPNLYDESISLLKSSFFTTISLIELKRL
jgi:hypothetical protein